MAMDADRTRARIVRAREALGLNQREAAEQAGISQPTWARVELGQKDLQLDDLLGIAHALGTTVGYLTGDSDLMNRVVVAARHDVTVDTSEVEDRLRHLMEIDRFLDAQAAPLR